MPIFISYSHHDKGFVDALAFQLVAHNIKVWVDRWELSIGDSILEKVQDAIEDSSALLVILSKKSTESEWCKKEINAGLLKELEEKRVIVIPVLIEDCDLPIFVRGKLYADFRPGFNVDVGLRTVLEGVSKISNPHLNRKSDEEYFIDWSIDWRDFKGNYALILTFVEQAKTQPYSCLTIIEVQTSDAVTERCKSLISDSDNSLANKYILDIVARHFASIPDVKTLLSNERAKVKDMPIVDSSEDELLMLRIESRRLGVDTGRDILLNTSSLIRQSHEHMSEVLSKSNRSV